MIWLPRCRGENLIYFPLFFRFRPRHKQIYSWFSVHNISLCKAWFCYPLKRSVILLFAKDYYPVCYPSWYTYIRCKVGWPDISPICRCLKGTFMQALPHQPHQLTVQQLRGSAAYNTSITIELRNMRSSIWSQQFRNVDLGGKWWCLLIVLGYLCIATIQVYGSLPLSVGYIHSGEIMKIMYDWHQQNVFVHLIYLADGSTRAINPERREEHSPLDKIVEFPWKTDLFKNKVPVSHDWEIQIEKITHLFRDRLKRNTKPSRW